MEQLDIFDLGESGTESGGKRPKEKSIRRPIHLFFAGGAFVILGLFGAAFLIDSGEPPPSVEQRLHQTTFPIAITEQAAPPPEVTPIPDPPESKREIVPSPEESFVSVSISPAPPPSPTIETEKREVPGIPPVDHTHLVRSSALKRASEAYRNDLSALGSFFTLRLEVNCKTESVLHAFRKGDYSPAMFILPRSIEGKPCYAVMWGVYASGPDATTGYDSLPPHFKAQKPGALITRLKPYLE